MKMRKKRQSLLKIFRITSICITVFMIVPVSAQSIENDLFPYAGVDCEWIFMRGHHEWGKALPTSYGGGNFYTGLRVLDVSAEVGYDFTTKKRNSTTLLKTRVRTDSWHIDLNGFFPFCTWVELIGTIGLASSKTTISAHVHKTQTHTLMLEPINANRKSILRMGGGLQYVFDDCIGIRGLIRWKNTEKFRLRLNSVNQTNGFNTKPCKDSVSITAGVFSYF